MEARKKRNIKSSVEYDHLFPLSENDDKTIRRNANVYHTVEFIPKVVHETLDQTKRIAQLLKAKTLYETCNNIWHFVYRHINYKKDQEGYEQIRSPARTWHDRLKGVDCDCYSVFISSILTNLGIPHILRITKYHRDYFQHIYPIVPASPPAPLQRRGGKEIVIDCVTDKFNYEVPYSEKKDYPMDLQYLNGFDDDDMGGLGKIIKKNMAKAKQPAKTKLPKTAKKPSTSLIQKLKAKKVAKPLPVRHAGNPATPALPGSSTASAKPGQTVAKQKKGILKKVVNAVNKVNPATVLLRNGILAAMKLNIKNVAARLRWSYLTAQQAATKNIDSAKFQKLIATRQKLEKIFFGAGGKPENLKKAILAGKGNKDKAVSGLGMLPMMEVSYTSEYIPLKQLLGNEIYFSENIDGMNGFAGFGDLGEPVTLTTIGAAMGVIAGIVASLKQIGDIFKSKQQGSEDFDESKTDTPENNANTSSDTSTVRTSAAATNTSLPETTSQEENISQNAAINNEVVRTTENFTPATTSSSNIVTDENDEVKTSPAANSTSDSPGSDTPDDKESFWDKNKKWIKPVAIGVGGLTVIAIAYKLSKGSKEKNRSSLHHELSGVPHKKKKNLPRRQAGKNHHRKHKHKKAVALI